MTPAATYLVVANAGAGGGSGGQDPALQGALDVLRDAGTVEVAATSTLEELSDVLADATADVVVVAGGDGTLHHAIAALHRHGSLAERPLALLPLGTGNDFARTLDIPLDAVEAAQVVIAAHSRRLDLMTDQDGSIVVNNVHLGAGADASRRAAAWKERLGSVGAGNLNLGRLGYPIGALGAISNPRALRLRVGVDGEEVTDGREPVLMVAVGIGTSVGGGAELTPEADPGDGYADILIARPSGVFGRLSFAARLTSGTHIRQAAVTYLRGTEVSVHGSKFWCSSDGEVAGPDEQRTWSVEPGAYTMLAPDPALSDRRD